MRLLLPVISQLVFANKYPLQHWNTTGKRGSEGYKGDPGYYAIGLRRKKKVIPEENDSDFLSFENDLLMKLFLELDYLEDSFSKCQVNTLKRHTQNKMLLYLD